MDDSFESEGLRLGAHFAAPAGPAPGVVVVHGFPRGPLGAPLSAVSFPELVDRIARRLGWAAMTFNLRGTGASEGDFSVAGWLRDLRNAVTALLERFPVGPVFVAGVAEGGTLALCEAVDDERVRGIATLAAPLTMWEWGARDAARLLDRARREGLIETPDFPSDAVAWARPLHDVDARRAAAALAPRPLLVMHGSDDDMIPVDDARAIARAAGDRAELHVVAAAGHRLRHDPRAVAALLGWLGRQTGTSRSVPAPGPPVPAGSDLDPDPG